MTKARNHFKIATNSTLENINPILNFGLQALFEENSILNLRLNGMIRKWSINSNCGTSLIRIRSM